jgi:hypothetical protein
MKGLKPWTIRIRMFFRFVLTMVMFYSFYYILTLLFHPTLDLDEKFRDLLNIIIGSFLVSFGKVVDFWFKKDDEDASAPHTQQQSTVHQQADSQPTSVDATSLNEKINKDEDVWD